VRVGLLHPGQMGAAVGSAVHGDVLWASEGRSEATALRAGAAGFTDAGSIDSLVQSCDVILSICPPGAAEEVARDVFDAGFERLFVEANAISPTRMRRIAELGSRVVDGSIIAASGINLYLAGDGADEAAGLFPNGDVKTIVLPGKVGAASALKMAFGGWNKIGIALTAQARAIAAAYGVEECLDEEGVATDRLPRMADRAWRWAPEMDEIAETCAELGVHTAIPRAAGEFYRDLAD
jgi:3-hydroxyisobutyrate dehydrogenase-like beta-hydroxyacid dehydrogenase